MALMQDFHFLRPAWLLALPLLWGLSFWLARRRGRDGEVLLRAEARERMVDDARAKAAGPQRNSSRASSVDPAPAIESACKSRSCLADNLTQCSPSQLMPIKRLPPFL